MTDSFFEYLIKHLLSNSFAPGRWYPVRWCKVSRRWNLQRHRSVRLSMFRLFPAISLVKKTRNIQNNCRWKIMFLPSLPGGECASQRSCWGRGLAEGRHLTCFLCVFFARQNWKFCKVQIMQIVTRMTKPTRQTRVTRQTKVTRQTRVTRVTRVTRQTRV